MIIWPSVSVPTEVGTLKVEFISDQYVIVFEPWKGENTVIDWLEEDDIEALGMACRMVVKMTKEIEGGERDGGQDD
jgi:hypothetical protein